MNILLTGCTSGLGYELSHLLQKDEQNNLFLISKNKKKLKKFKKYKNVKLYNLDLKNLRQVHAVTKKILKDSRKLIDVIICNAAHPTRGSIKDTPHNAFREDLDINFFSNLIIIKKILPIMTKRREGHIINISSGAAIVGLKNLSSYSVSKSSMQILFESARNEFLQFNVYFKNFFPGTINTEFEKKAKNYGLFEKKKVKKKSVEKAAIKILNSLYTKRFNNFVSTSTMASFILKSMPSINKY